jgi:hypothetical protein
LVGALSTVEKTKLFGRWGWPRAAAAVRDAASEVERAFIEVAAVDRLN